jgi:hypothetical protein
VLGCGLLLYNARGKTYSAMSQSPYDAGMCANFVLLSGQIFSQTEFTKSRIYVIMEFHKTGLK